VHLVGGISREIDWPEITLTAGRLGRDLVLVTGPEPSLRWRAVLGELVDAARQLGITEAYAVGGIPAMASHRRPMSVLATGTDEAVVARAGAWRQDYTGPTGAQSVLQVMLGDAGIPSIALWAQVPHYLAGGASPPAIRAVVGRLRELAALNVDLEGLDDQSATYERRVEEGLTDRPDVLEVIAAIEAGVDDEVDESELPSGDELASEIERFLRDQS
jgi:proteasome assembly chaperone (PAC2) family protein